MYDSPRQTEVYERIPENRRAEKKRVVGCGERCGGVDVAYSRADGGHEYIGVV